MNIALCDDDGRFRAQTTRVLVDILEKRGVKANVTRFRDAESVLDAVGKGMAFDFALLDIVLPGMDGVMLARQLRARFPSLPVIFFTTSTDFAVQAFSIGAVHYVVKPFTREQFVTAIDRALAHMPRSRTNGVVFKTNEGLVTVPYDDIVYSETDEHYQKVRFTNGEELFTRMSGQELWRMVEVSGKFVRAGLKYVINVSKITGIDKNLVRLASGHEIEVPRRSAAEVKAAYLKFCCG